MSLPAFTATPELSRFLANEGQRLSDAERLLARHGFEYGDPWTFSQRVLDLFDGAVIAAEICYPS